MTPDQLQALAAEVAKVQFVGIDASQIANELNAVTVATKVDVATEDMREILLGTGAWADIELLSRETATDLNREAVRAAINAVRTLTITTVLRLSLPAHLAAFEAVSQELVTAGALSSSVRTALLAKADGFTSRSKQLGFNRLIQGVDVERARAV